MVVAGEATSSRRWSGDRQTLQPKRHVRKSSRNGAKPRAPVPRIDEYTIAPGKRKKLFAVIRKTSHTELCPHRVGYWRAGCRGMAKSPGWAYFYDHRGLPDPARQWSLKRYVTGAR